MAKNLPGLNYDSKLNIDDLTFQSDETEKAILDRTTIVFGDRALAQPRYGIIDLVNPRNVIEQETTRPLLVYSATPTATSYPVNITVGTAVTLNGAIVMNPSLVENFTLVRTVLNDIVVVFIENEIIDAPPKRKTRYNVDQYTRRIQSSTVLKSVLLADYQNDVLFPPSRRKNIVVLTVVTVVQGTSGLELQFDHSNTSYSFVRPWYSPVDVEHRSKLGGGTATETNTHGLTYNDLVSGNLTLYDQLLSVGAILARDDVVNGICGTPCYETIEPSRILQDGSGITSESRFGGIGSYYIVLANYPTYITSFYLQANKGRDIAWDHIKGTKIVVLPTPETFSEPAVIWYNRVYSLAPPNQILSNSLAFSQPDQTKELVLTGGLALSSLTNQFIDFDGSGSVPRKYTLYVTGDGTILRSPQLIQTTMLLDDIGTMITPISASIFGPAKISVGLSGANPVPAMQIMLQFTGRDVDDNPITDTITFNGTTWQSTPPLENPNQYILTTNVYRVLSSIQVMSRTSDGPNSKIQLWAELETGTTTGLAKLAKIATVMWDGTAIAELKDQRKISRVIPEPQNRYRAAAGIIGFGGLNNPSLCYSDDFSIPLLKNTASGLQSATAATTKLIINDYTRITFPISLGDPQDNIVLPNGKTLYAVGSAPNRSAGEFAVNGGAPPSNMAVRDDIVLTINDSVFSSGYTAVADSVDNRLIISANVLGARGNGLVTINEQIANAFAVSPANGLVGGIDAFSECFLSKHATYIDTSIPSTGTYDVSTYRGRYLSIPLPVASLYSICIAVHDVDPPQTNIQLRVRFANNTDPTWLPWEVITSTTGSFFSITKSFRISKIQVQLFGKASGFSVYEVS